MPLAAAVLVLALCRPGGSGLRDFIISPPGLSGRGVRGCGVGCGWADYVWDSLFVCAVWVGFSGRGWEVLRWAFRVRRGGARWFLLGGRWEWDRGEIVVCV